ncbi:MAG: GNAT family N-acetyltransferase [Clostridiales bacterium]|nr:GNAT family N-acetyltransferase [Clostridiales bacterium]
MTITDSFNFATNYKDDPKLRKSFNDLTQKIYGFDFEDWYKEGYWGDSYIPYSLAAGGRMIANVSVSIMDFLVSGKKKKAVQIGTVMTDIDYRHQGLSRYLMDIVLAEYQDKCDLFFLFANDSVIDFYPKFGFEKAAEYECSKKVEAGYVPYSCRKINIDRPEDKQLLTRLVLNALPIAEVSLQNSAGLVMFYCNSVMKNSIYYIAELDIAVIAEYGENSLHILDIYSEKPFELAKVIYSLVKNGNERVFLGFSPLNNEGFSLNLRREENTTLFVKGENILEKAMFPVLSHT